MSKIRHIPFLNEVVTDIKDAISGVCDIIAEWVSENETARNIVRNLFQRQAQISTKLVKGKEKDGDKYRDYFDWEEPLSRISSHLLLAILCAESEGTIRVNVAPDEEEAIECLRRRFVKPITPRLQTKSRISDHAKKHLLST